MNFRFSCFIMFLIRFPKSIAQNLKESFNNIVTLGISGWLMQNLISPIGLVGWQQANIHVFSPITKLGLITAKYCTLIKLHNTNKLLMVT